MLSVIVHHTYQFVFQIIDAEERKQELGKALKCYRAVVELSSKIDESLVEEARRKIYQIEAMQLSMHVVSNLE